MSAAGGVIANLERRIAALESFAGAEDLTPNYLTITSSGLVGAQFTGIITALGLTIPAGVSSAGPENRIVWQRTADGALVAGLGEWETGSPGTGSSNLSISAGAIQGGAYDSQTSQLSLFAYSNAASPSWLGVNADPNPLNQTVQGYVGGGDPFILMRGDGQSSFVQVMPAHTGTPQNLGVQAQYLTIGAVAAGWSSHAVVFPVAFSALPAIVFNVNISAGGSIVGQELQTPTATGFTADIDSTVPQNIGIFWIAIGPT